MSPQAIEIAQDGLANGRSAAGLRKENQSAKRYDPRLGWGSLAARPQDRGRCTGHEAVKLLMPLVRHDPGGLSRLDWRETFQAVVRRCDVHAPSLPLSRRSSHARVSCARLSVRTVMRVTLGRDSEHCPPRGGPAVAARRGEGDNWRCRTGFQPSSEPTPPLAAGGQAESSARSAATKASGWSIIT